MKKWREKIEINRNKAKGKTDLDGAEDREREREKKIRAWAFIFLSVCMYMRAYITTKANNKNWAIAEPNKLNDTSSVRFEVIAVLVTEH